MQYLIGDIYGLIHLLASIVALISGSLVLIMAKGTRRHKQVGYVYIAAMILSLLTAFMIYRLFGGWGIFHYAALLSALTIVLGMIPALTQKPPTSWKYLHFSFMYWSVMGLYAAFVAELLTRVPDTPFYGMVGIATAAVMMLGGVFFAIKKSKWSRMLGN